MKHQEAKTQDRLKDNMQTDNDTMIMSVICMNCRTHCAFSLFDYQLSSRHLLHNENEGINQWMRQESVCRAFDVQLTVCIQAYSSRCCECILRFHLMKMSRPVIVHNQHSQINVMNYNSYDLYIYVLFMSASQMQRRHDRHESAYCRNAVLITIQHLTCITVNKQLGI